MIQLITTQKKFFQALSLLMLFFLIMLLLGNIYSSSFLSLKLYEKVHYSNSPAHWFAGKLSLANGKPNACLVLGASTSREGFDEDLISKSIKDKLFFNGSTTGAIQNYEGMAKIIDRFNAKVDCIVLPLHSWQINEGDLQLNNLGFTDLLSFRQMLEFMLTAGMPLISKSEEGTSEEFLLNSILPFRHHARIISRHIRTGLWKLHNSLFNGKPLKQSDFELTPGDLNVKREFAYTETERLPEEELQKYLVSMKSKYFDHQKYGRKTYTDSLRNTLNILTKHSKKILIVIMPDSNAMSEPVLLNSPHFFKVLKEFQKPNIYCVDFSDLIDDKYLRDHNHPLPSGRKILSKKLSTVIENPVNTCNFHTVNKFKETIPLDYIDPSKINDFNF